MAYGNGVIYSAIVVEGKETADCCRYCKSTNGSKAWYISSDKLLVDDYQILLDRGWRRQGMRIRKPLNDVTCCPSHPIWCDAMGFKISKGQKRAISILEDYLRTGDVPGGAKLGTLEPSEAAQSPLKSAAGSKVSKGSGALAATKSPPGQAVKLSPAESLKLGRQLKAERMRPKELEDYMQRVERKEGDVHTLDIRVYKCSPLSPEISATLSDEYKLFDKYLTSIHKLPPGSVSREEFEATYVDTPFVDTNDDELAASGAPLFGTYHHQYWLDGNKLLAVGVVDLLPGCLSSVYFFHSPLYTCLNLGTFSSLWEIAYVRKLQRLYGEKSPIYANLKYYTMGYYVHSSNKMNYKSGYHPSYLSCPITHTWVPIDQCKRILDGDKYSRLAPSDAVDPFIPPPDDEVAIQLPFSEELQEMLQNLEYIVEGEAVVTSLSVAKDLLYEDDVDLIREWVSLVKNTGDMRVLCKRWIGMH